LSKIKDKQEEKELREKIICVAENISLNKMIST